MYSIFSTNNKNHCHLEEGEPPPKKLVAEEDILIKQLAENQLKTNISLAEHLSKKKEFTSSESFSNITSYISGKTDLRDFKTKVANVDEVNTFRRKGLSDKDIEIYKDSATMGPEFWVKYKSTNKDVLSKHIDEIKAIVTTESDCNCRVPSTSNKQHEYLDSLKSSSTNDLKLAAQNESERDHLPGPMDELPRLETQFMNDLKEYSSCDIKKIRKKARSMSNKIRNLEMDKDPVDTGIIKNNNFQKHTQWGVKGKPTRLQKIETIDKDKVYGCKSQNWYTVKDSKIIKLDKDKTIPQNIPDNKDKSKLTLEEIKNIPKFTNYDPGIPSKVLFLKNLGKNVTEKDLRDILKQFNTQCYCLKVMGGKMRGQAFIEFQDTVQATEALGFLNGIILERKPIIVQYGKGKT